MLQQGAVSAAVERRERAKQGPDVRETISSAEKTRASAKQA